MKRYLSWLPHPLSGMAFLGGVLLPFFIVWQNTHYQGHDYGDFSNWAECWLKDRNIGCTAYEEDSLLWSCCLTAQPYRGG